jgi:hypothetical protein
MAKVSVVFHDGTSTETEVPNYNAADIVAKLNDEKILTVVIGDVIAHRGSVARVTPVVSVTAPAGK